MNLLVAGCSFREAWNRVFAERVHSLLLPVIRVDESVIDFNSHEAILKEPSEMLMGLGLSLTSFSPYRTTGRSGDQRQ
jgi:hypothetical protein